MIVLFGGTGTLGHALAKIIDRVGHDCTIVSRCENRQRAMSKEFPRFKYVLGDVTNTTWANEIKKRPSMVFNH
jgi:nucleoside-diphosphate-sugar epimerase